jgi:hypothetical protein
MMGSTASAPIRPTTRRFDITQLAAIVGCSPGNELHPALLQKWHEDWFPERAENLDPKS